MLSQDADRQHVCIDSSIVRANAGTAGVANSTDAHEALGRSRGSVGNKTHVLADALGMPVRFILTPGQAAYIT